MRATIRKGRVTERKFIDCLTESNDFYDKQIRKYEAEHQMIQNRLETKLMDTDEIKHCLKTMAIIGDMLTQYKIWKASNDMLIENHSKSSR